MEKLIKILKRLSRVKAGLLLKNQLLQIQAELLKDKVIVLLYKFNGDLEKVSDHLSINDHDVTPEQLRVLIDCFEIDLEVC